MLCQEKACLPLQDPSQIKLSLNYKQAELKSHLLCISIALRGCLSEDIEYDSVLSAFRAETCVQHSVSPTPSLEAGSLQVQCLEN